MVSKVALLTAGGFAPCLSSAIAGLIQRYTQVAPQVDIICYRNGFEGLLKADSFPVVPAVREQYAKLFQFGGSPIGNSRVKLTNVPDLIKRGMISEGEDPLRKAAEQLVADGVDVLHTIGGDDTNTTAGDLARYMRDHGYPLTVVGLPKTIDNDIVPIKQSLGAWSAAGQGALFARNVIAEHNSVPHELIIHEIMGRNCGYLAAETARRYRQWLDASDWLPEIGLDRAQWEVHALYIPEAKIDLNAEADRLGAIMQQVGNVNIFLSEGAGVSDIVAQMQAGGESVPQDAFGHVKLDKINPGAWFGKRFAERIGAEKVMVQKSGYFARSAKSNQEDVDLILRTCEMAVDAALADTPGVVGLDEENGGTLSVIAFERIAGHKPFDITTDWYLDLLDHIGQPRAMVAV